MQDKGATILAVDDSPATLQMLTRHLVKAGYVLHTCASVEEAGDFLGRTVVDLVITDYRMPDSSGLDLVKYVRENFRDTEIMMVTGYPSINGAVEAMRDGAVAYLPKPFTGEELLEAVRDILDRQARRRFAHAEDRGPETYGIIGRCPEMRTVFELIGKASRTSANVLISGDSGTGKELVARAVHYNSSRRAAAFVPVNCAAIPETLLESELFGHVKGAFSGAKESRAGFFEIANGGTIFLDEIGDASPGLQAKLLRVMLSGARRRLPRRTRSMPTDTARPGAIPSSKTPRSSAMASRWPTSSARPDWPIWSARPCRMNCRKILPKPSEAGWRTAMMRRNPENTGIPMVPVRSWAFLAATSETSSSPRSTVWRSRPSSARRTTHSNTSFRRKRKSWLQT